MGVGMPMYYVPITGLAMGSVEEHEMASAAGLMNFVRTIAGAFATSLVTTFWQDRRYIAHDQLSSIVDPTGQMGVIVQGLPAQNRAVRTRVAGLRRAESKPDAGHQWTDDHWRHLLHLGLCHRSGT